MRHARIIAFALMALAALCGARSQAQAALLLEQPYGLYGFVNPTGHNAIYLQRVCTVTPVKLRRCRPGELGSVIARYEGIDGYDWVAMPLIPYLYSVERAGEVPAHVDHNEVVRMRERYREAHFHQMGLDQSGGNWVRNGWTQLVGAAYERRIYAYRFYTTRAQDDELIARLNADPNQTHFHMLTRNCADFARSILNIYFPHTFRRAVFPDAGITTPDEVTNRLLHYAHKHPGIDLKVFEIPQVPGYRRQSRDSKDIAQAFATTAYAVPITVISPYFEAGVFVDYLARGRYHLIPKHPEVVESDNLIALTEPGAARENAGSAAQQAPGASTGAAESPAAMAADSSPTSGLREIKAMQ
jgi:hypothetical protein